MRKLIRKGTIGLKIPSFKGLYTPSFNYSYSDFKKATSKEYPELEYFNYSYDDFKKATSKNILN